MKVIALLFIFVFQGCAGYRLRPGAALEAAQIYQAMDPYAHHKQAKPPVCVGVKDPVTNLYRMQCQ
jgi:hypothetical protein